MSVWDTTVQTVVPDIEQLIARVSLGKLPGCFMFDKFGRRDAVAATEADVWQGPGVTETLLTSAQTMYASCTDNVNGVGQVLLVRGLDGDWGLQTGLVTLTGQTQAAITKTDGTAATWTRIDRVFQISSAPDPVGDVYIAESDTLTGGVPDTATGIHAVIDYSNAPQQTEKAMVTVPMGYWGIITGFRGSMLASSGSNRSAQIFAEIQMLSSTSELGSLSWAPFRRIAEIGFNNAGTQALQEKPFSYQPLPQLTNLHMRAVASAASDVTAAFGIIYVPSAFIAPQPPGGVNYY